MKLSDIIAKYLLYKGVGKIFGYQGGSITHMIDSFDKYGIDYIQTYNEQGAVFAADGFARIRNHEFGVVIATNGPGATNIVTGIADAYCDSVPILCLTGQVHTFAMKGDKPVRQENFQEIDIISIVKPITKYAVTVMREEDAIPQLAKALDCAVSGRKGPVLIDIPVDVQGRDLEVDDFEKYFKDIEAKIEKRQELEIDEKEIEKFVIKIEQSKRPLIIAGGGIRSSVSTEYFREFVQRNKIPVVTSLMGLDTVPIEWPEFIGFIGGYGNRYANLAVQNADLIIVLGSRLDGRQTGKRRDLFGSNAYIIHVEIDGGEINHFIHADMSICIDINSFLKKICSIKFNIDNRSIQLWTSQIEKWRTEFKAEEELSDRIVNPNIFMKKLSSLIEKDCCICFDVGQNQMWSAQSLRVNGAGTRILNSGGLGAMGFSLPAAIGACFANNLQNTYAIMGDGGLQMNIQELQVISQYKLPISIIVINNHALGLIRDIHEKYYNKRYVGSVKGFSSPHLEKIAEAYDMKYMYVSKEEDLDKVERGPIIIEIDFQEETYVAPELLGNDGLDNQQPYRNMER